MWYYLNYETGVMLTRKYKNIQWCRYALWHETENLIYFARQFFEIEQHFCAPILHVNKICFSNLTKSTVLVQWQLKQWETKTNLKYYFTVMPITLEDQLASCQIYFHRLRCSLEKESDKSHQNFGRKSFLKFELLKAANRRSGYKGYS